MNRIIYIPSKLVMSHIDMADLDLSYLPEYPILEEKGGKNRLLGIVCRYNVGESYAFVITNMQGIDNEALPNQPVQLFLDKREWNDSVSLKEDMWITFELKKQPKRNRHAAINAKHFSATLDDFNIYRQYVGVYNNISGIVNKRPFEKSIQSVITDVFFTTKEGRVAVLNSLYQSHSSDVYLWELLLSNMTVEEKGLCAFGIDGIELTAELRLCFYKNLGSIKWIKHPSVISTFLLTNEFQKSINLLNESFKTDDDKQEWIEYARLSNQSSDKLLSALFIMTYNIDILNSITNKAAIIDALSEDKAKEFILFCMTNLAKTEFDRFIESVKSEMLIDLIKLMSEEECLQFVCGLSSVQAIKIVSDERLVSLDLKNKLLSKEEGRRIILDDIYNRKSNDYNEWDDYLSHLDETQSRLFVLDTKRITPTAELRICLYKYTWVNEWIKHPSVVYLIGNLDNEQVITIEHFLLDFHSEEDKNEWISYVLGCSICSEKLKLDLFYLTENIEVYNAIKRKADVIEHMNDAEELEVCKFLKFCYINLNDANFKEIIDGLSDEKFIVGLKAMSIDDGFQLLNRLPEGRSLEIVTSQPFKGGELFSTYIGQIWDSVKGEMPYCVFDLESDGNIIKEFAFLAEDNMRQYNGEDQINSLFRKLKKVPIIVGHNIKHWDLPILYKKGLEIPSSTFIWDTLEIEIMLNPCRYAYSLRTKHNAVADTDLTNKLFWNQLYRLSEDHLLIKQLRNVLPAGIEKIINSLQIDYFSEYFKITANLDHQFFQELRPLSKTLLKELGHIAKTPESEETLLIAPNNLWARLAQHIPLNFPGALISESLRSINIEELKKHPFADTVRQIILERFCEVSRTPILENLAQYLRALDADTPKLSFSDDELQKYLYHFDSHIDCIDVSSFEDPTILSKNYKHIYVIGSELEDRIHKCKLCENKSFADLTASGSRLPFTMATTNYAPVKDEEMEKLGIPKPEQAANIWVEREQNGQFAFYMNYDYLAYRKRFLDHFNTVILPIKWNFSGKDYDHINITQVSRNRKADMVMRVSSSTTQRSKYWLFQMALLNKIHQANINLPIIYVINEEGEIDKLTKYAVSQGYYIPTYGTSFRKLEYIGDHAHGMVIITKEEFINGIGAYRTDRPFCYVWDNMDIDRYLLMWNKLPFEDDLEEDINDERDDKVRHSTPRQCIHAAWPIFKHYCSLVMANSEATQFYIIDPHFDDYEDIANSCKADSFKVDLWSTNDDYKDALGLAREYFDDYRGEVEEIETGKAIEMIREHFIGNYDWKPMQKEILPYIWEKRGDCIVSMPTGEGKSVCFQGPALYRASISKKLSLVITPLRALMQDQVEALQMKGFVTNVDYLSGDRQRPEVENIYRKLRSGEIALLYITPERFRVKSFMNVLLQRMEIDGGLEYVIFDEAHCISQWGQEFRPDYRNAVMACIDLRKDFDFMVAMFSATVTNQVEEDIRSFKDNSGEEPLRNIQRLGQTAEEYNPIRQHIGISFTLTEHEDVARISEIVHFIENNKIDFSLSSMIIFCRTHRQCEETADTLSNIALTSPADSILYKCVDRIGFYHAGLDADLRKDVYEQFKRKEGIEPLYILCATKAFGMGMDIPNIHYVVHYTPPAVLEDYLQEVGRAGRDEKKYGLAFPDKGQIPALCLTARDDFRKLKELLVKSQLSWSNLTDAKDKIVEFIKQFQTIEQTKNKSIVVPFDVWVKNTEDFNDTTASRLAFHWLDHIKSIELGYLSQACLDITLHNQGGKPSLLRQSPIYLYLGKNAQINGQRSLVSINDMRSSIGMSMPKIMNQILLCEDKGLLELNDTINCKLFPRRYCEANYMVAHNRNDFALHIVFEGLRNLLSDCKIGEEKAIGQVERGEIFKHLMDDIVYNDIVEINGVKYMPWKAEIENPPRLAVTRYETFRKNIISRMGAQMFTFLHFLPMVGYKVENQDDDVVCLIKVKNNGWQPYLNELESHCLTMIKHVVENVGEFQWARIIVKYGWTQKGYRYFENILSILHLLAYIDHTPLVKTGIEVKTTDSTELEISDGLSEDSNMYSFRNKFDNYERIKKVRLACMDIFTHIHKEEQGEYIQQYFQCKNYREYIELAGDHVPKDSDIMSELTEEALKIEEARLEKNKEQKYIYEQPVNKDINVLAGPGAGKTHVLTLRCARLIYKEYIDPTHILVLAYNRAVVVELRNRLNDLFIKLGMSRIAHQLNVYTFHALAKKCMGKNLDDVPTKCWEYAFLQYLNNPRNLQSFKMLFPQIDYILVDEFQDITQYRLDLLLKLKELYNSRFFTIGDINQSIYGFDRSPKDCNGCGRWCRGGSANTPCRFFPATPSQYANALDPKPYYEKLNVEIQPETLSMFTNYRSYQKILDKASSFTHEGKMPISAPQIMEYEPTEPYVEEYDNLEEKGHVWYKDIGFIVNWAKAQNIEAEQIQENETLKRMRHIDTIAIFFRTNNEVYRGYSKIKRMMKDVRIRIQGESDGEMWREREIYYLIHTLNCHPNEKIELHNNKTANGIKAFLKKKMDESPSWDALTLDITYTLVLNYIDSIRSDFTSHSWKDLADYLVDIADLDDAGQIYKIYENYRSQRILRESPLTIVLTTMHKVKGLEFDVVITTPSYANLPLRPHHDYEKGVQPLEDDLADMDEERRLLFVAYTRAKKRLIIYKAARERALSQNSIYNAPEYTALRYTETKPGLDKYYISYTAQSIIFENIDSYISNNIKKDDPVEIRLGDDQYNNYYIIHNGHYVGRLSSNSNIRHRAERDGVISLRDFFVSNVYVWRYEDTIATDMANNTNFAAKWSDAAKKQGFIYLVQIAGFGVPNL